MPQVKFSPGPFLEQYEDGHPPEKETEEERRRYRCGLVLKGGQSVNTFSFEEAFQSWLERQCKSSKKPPEASYEITEITNETIADSVPIEFEKKFLDLSPFAAESLAVDIPCEGDNPIEAKKSTSCKGGDQSQEEVKVASLQCNSVPL